MVVPPAAVACHEWPGVPGTQVATSMPVVGTTHDTSPTSVDPVSILPVRSATSPTLASGAGAASVDWISRANASSSGV